MLYHGGKDKAEFMELKKESSLLTECSLYLLARCSSLKICTVSVLLEAHRNCESILKTRELIVTYLETAIHEPISQKHGDYCLLVPRSVL